MCLCLLGCVFPSPAEETAIDETELTEEDLALLENLRFVDRFGANAQVEADEAGEPVAVNGYPTYMVRAGFNNLGQTDSFQTVADFVDYPFWQPSTQYDGNLAVLSLIMAGCAFRADRFSNLVDEDYDPALNLVHFLSDAGFSDIRKDDYSKVPTMFTVSTAIAHRVMTHEGEEPFTLIAIGVCGDRYKNEWESNMTAGTGDIHEGFQSAARLVIDRLAGYIATRGIHGRIKVWISGFSRAAAVSNVVAGTLIDTGFIPKEDIYAYTFATPAAIKNPPKEGYESIFNIVNPADVVPQVMPAEWGYGRYGTDLYLPVQEFSSFEGFIDSFLRSFTNKYKYNVDYNYSSMLTLRLRLLISLTLDLTENVENYCANFQSALVSILHDKTLTNMISIIRSLMQNIKLTDREDKAHLDDLIDYFMRVFSGIALRSGYNRADSNTGSMLYRLMIEHTPNTYLSAETDIRDGDFQSNDKCCYLMVRGPVSLTLLESQTLSEVFTVHSDGSTVFADEYKDIELIDQLFYIERNHNTTVIALPMDYDYQVAWMAEKDGTVEILQAMAFVQASSKYPGAETGKIKVSAGDSGVAFQSKDGEVIPLEGFSEAEFNARTLAEFMGIASLGFNWRTALTLLYAVIALIFCIPLCLIIRHVSKKNRYSFLACAVLCLLGVAIVETETAYWFFADQTWVRGVWKGIAGLWLFVLYYLLHRGKEKPGASFFPFLLSAMAADIVITFHFSLGLGLFLLSHVMLTYLFQRRRPMSLGKWIQWGILSAALAALIILFYVPSHGLIGWGVAVYAPVLLLMVFSSGKQPIRIRVSSSMLLISDLLLGMYATLLNDPMIHVVYMFLFYIALLLIATYSSNNSMEQETAAVSEA